MVYHFDNSDTQTTPGLRTLRHCMDGAKDKKNPDIKYGAVISDLVAKGVKCDVCELTLRAMDIKKNVFVMDAGFTPSGVVRIGQLQGQGDGYIKP